MLIDVSGKQIPSSCKFEEFWVKPYQVRCVPSLRTFANGHWDDLGAGRRLITDLCYSTAFLVTSPRRVVYRIQFGEHCIKKLDWGWIMLKNTSDPLTSEPISSGITNLATPALVYWTIPRYYVLLPSLQLACDQVLDISCDIEV